VIPCADGSLAYLSVARASSRRSRKHVTPLAGDISTRYAATAWQAGHDVPARLRAYHSTLTLLRRPHCLYRLLYGALPVADARAEQPRCWYWADILLSKTGAWHRRSNPYRRFSNLIRHATPTPLDVRTLVSPYTYASGLPFGSLLTLPLVHISRMRERCFIYLG